MKVTNITNNNGNKVPNQFIITDSGAREVFQSYNSTIVQRNFGGKIYLDKKYWNYSNTTSKYRNIFLNETTKQTQAKINSGEYTLTNLN